MPTKNSDIMKTAIVIGATGLVGRELVKQLLEHPSFSTVKVLVRRPLDLQHPRLQTHVIRFDDVTSWAPLVTGDVLFSALGTTLRQAGSKEAQYLVDHTYQLEAAKSAANNSVPAYVLVSSAGADTRSRIFYSRMKGELERDVRNLSFQSITIIQPSLLAGDREKERWGEKISDRFLKLFNSAGLFRKYRPVPGATVARAMIRASIQQSAGVHTYTLDEVFTLAGEA